MINTVKKKKNWCRQYEAFHQLTEIRQKPSKWTKFTHESILKLEPATNWPHRPGDRCDNSRASLGSDATFSHWELNRKNSLAICHHLSSRRWVSHCKAEYMVREFNTWSTRRQYQDYRANVTKTQTSQLSTLRNRDLMKHTLKHFCTCCKELTVSMDLFANYL